MKKNYVLFFLFLFAVNFYTAQVVYTGKPMYNIAIKRGGIYIGTIKVELFPAIAPLAVRNFDSLVSVQFYDTTAFHRVIPGFMIQGGDPNSRHGATSTWGYGQPGQPTVNAEFSVAKHVRGILSAARSTNINSATSQFFICVATAANLNGQYTLYGRVIGGMNIADTIVLAPRNANDLPNIKHEMYITYVGSNDTIPAPPTLNTPTNTTTGLDPQAAVLLKWNPISSGMIYTLQVSEDTNFVTIFKTLETGNLLTYLNSGLQANKKYFWHVKVNNGGHVSNWSPTWMFKMAAPPPPPPPPVDTTGITTYSGIEKIRVFPNPSQGKFTFSNLEKGNKIEIYDGAGKLVYEAVAKETCVIIDLESGVKGVYSYKISSDSKDVLQGKLIVK